MITSSKRKKLLKNKNVSEDIKALFSNQAPVTAYTLPTKLRTMALDAEEDVTFVGYEVRRKKEFANLEIPEVIEDVLDEDDAQTLEDNIACYYVANVFSMDEVEFRHFPSDMPEDASGELTFKKTYIGVDKTSEGVAIPKGATERYDAFAIV